MQRLDVMHPNKCDLIVGPLPLHDNIELVVAGTLERPYMTGRHVLDDFKRVSTMNFGKRHSSHGILRTPVAAARAQATQGATSLFARNDNTAGPLPLRRVHCEIIFFRRLPESRFSSRKSKFV